MPITDAQLQEIDLVLSTAAPDSATLATLRQLGGGLTATRCDTADLADETPFRTYARCAVYLLDGRDHCMRITNNPIDATGIVVVAKG